MKNVTELNKLKVRLFVEAVWNEGRLELIDELVAADYVGHVPCLEVEVLGPEGVRGLVSSGRRAYPDMYVKIKDQIAEDDRVVTRWQATATAQDAHAHGAATRGTQSYTGISIVRLLGGKQVDAHTEYTVLAPAPPPRTPRPRTRSPGRARAV